MYDLCISLFGIDERNLVQIGRTKGWNVVRHMTKYKAGKTKLYYASCLPCITEDLLPTPLTLDIVTQDVGELEYNAAPGSLFQVASNFHGLEQTDKDSSPEDTLLFSYFNDHTQGPAAVLPTALDLVTRRYLLKGGEFTNAKLASGSWPLDMLKRLHNHGVGITMGGWADVSLACIPKTLKSKLDAARNVACVLVQDALVTHSPDGSFVAFENRRVHQVLTSTLDANFSSSADWTDVFLIAAYLNTLCAARDLRCSNVYLTLVGGGVFKNSSHAIFSAMATAINSVIFEIAPKLHLVLRPPMDAEIVRCFEWVRAFAANEIHYRTCILGITSGKTKKKKT